MKGKYKETDIGVVPKDWGLMQYGIAFDFLKTATYSRNELTKNDNVYYIHYGDIHTKWLNFLDFTTSELPTVKDSKVMGYPFVKNGDLIMADVSEDYKGVGTSVEVKNEKNILAISGLHTFLLRDRLSLFVNGFKAFIHANPLVKKQFYNLTTGMKVFSVSKANLKTILIPYPPDKAEQSAIATALYDSDSLITGLNKLIDKKRNIKRGAMQELLKPKKGWVKRRLGDTAILKARIGWQGLTTSEYRKSGEYLLITGTEFKNGFIDWDNCSYVDESRFKQDKYIQIKEMDVLVTKDGTIGKVAIINSLPKPATLNSGVFVIRPIGDSFNSDFFYYVLNSEMFVKFLSELVAGSTINHLYQRDFVEFEFMAPSSLLEQKRIAKILFDMDLAIEAIEKKLNKYKMIRQGMMQVLLTGKIRLV